MAVRLLKAALPKPKLTAEDAITIVEYHMRRNHTARQSHRKAWLRKHVRVHEAKVTRIESAKVGCLVEWRMGRAAPRPKVRLRRPRAERARPEAEFLHWISPGRRPSFRADHSDRSNRRLLDYVEHGGTVIVQYNKTGFNQTGFGPYPAQVSGNRVTDEYAPVKVLAPAHPVFHFPNPIGPATWANWVQERGLYFLGEKDSRYVDLVAMTDPFKDNPGEKLGALVEGRVGKGRWIYVALGLWRQLPAGTAGAYQLLANLIALRCSVRAASPIAHVGGTTQIRKSAGISATSA